MVPLLLVAHRAVLGHHPLGASTGFMTADRGDWDALIAQARAMSMFTAELSALGEDELPGLVDYLAAGPELPFRYLSVHAPSKRLRMPEAERTALLARLPSMVHAIVVHPDTIEDPAAYAVLGRRLVLENMDDRKHHGRTAAELAPLFDALPSAGWCFDVAHASSMGADMSIADELLDRFSERLRHVHLSSLDPGGHHVELRNEDAERFTPALDRCRDVPWILEAALPES